MGAGQNSTSSAGARPNWWLPVVLATGLTALATSSAVQAQPQALKAELTQLAQQHVIFGHQSVGDNLLSGVQQLAIDAGVPLAVTAITSTANAVPVGLAHAYVDENTQPLKKLQSFERLLSAKPPGRHLAALKFCYVDVHAGTDVGQLFAQYQQTMATIQAKHPDLRLVHFTVPLTTVQGGWKATVKRWLGKAPGGVMDNIRREAYNDMVRKAYGKNSAVFDLARVESTLPDGGAYAIEWGGKQVPALVPSYSNDGEHLNQQGQVHAARALVATLAKASQRE